MPPVSSQQLMSPIKIHKRNSLILLKEIHLKTWGHFMAIRAPNFMAVKEPKVKDMVAETVPSLSVNFVGRWVTFFSNVTIVLTHSSLVSLITIHTHILVLLHQDLLAMQAIVVAPNTQDDGVWFLDSGVQIMSPMNSAIWTLTLIIRALISYMWVVQVWLLHMLDIHIFQVLTLLNPSFLEIFYMFQISPKISSMFHNLPRIMMFIEFHSSLCFVKDMVTWAIVLKGILKDGLYQFHLPKLSFPLNQFFTSLPGYHHIPASSSPTQFSSPSVSRVYTASLCSSSNSNLVHCNQICMSSIGLWHQRLTHPVDKIVKIVLD